MDGWVERGIVGGSEGGRPGCREGGKDGWREILMEGEWEGGRNI